MNLDILKYSLTEKDYNELMYSFIIVIILCVIIYINAFENNNYTCKNILVNTYLYVLISLLIFHIITMLLVNKELHIKFFSIVQNINKYLLMFGTLALMMGLFMIFHMNSTNILISHFMLILLIGIFSLLMSAMYSILKKKNLYNKVFYTTLLFVFVLLTILYFYQDLIKKYLKEEYYYIILILLFVVFLVEMIYILFIEYNKNVTIMISAIVLVIFGYILLSDTQKLLDITENNCKIALKNCNKNIYNLDCNMNNYPNYPQKSFEIFHDIIVIFQRIAQIFLANNNND